jgi:hypothetical protein
MRATDETLRHLVETGDVDVEAARHWLADALDCLTEPLDGFSVGNAANQTAKAMVALGHPEIWSRDEEQAA